ncbi:Glutathione S-transferase zeta-1 [Podila horticola]|nr:Glutathione S-transferase zeta-1 [Podila horticola]
MSQATLYNFFRSSCSYRARIALNLKSIPYISRSISLEKGEQNTPEYLAIQPLGMIPALVIDGEVITQSIAMIEYLDETRPEVPLLPKDPKARVKVRELAYAVAMDIQPAQKMTIHGFTGVEALLAKTAGKYCYGDSITLADLTLVPGVFNARRFRVDMALFPIISRIDATLVDHPAFKAAHPYVQPDTPEKLRLK